MGQHFVLGYDMNIGKNFRIKIETYYQYLFRVPLSKVNQQFSTLNQGTEYYTAIPDSLVNKGKGRNIGLEFTLEKFFCNGYYALATLSLFDSKYSGYDRVWRNTSFNNQYIINFLGGYEFKVNQYDFINLGIRGTWAGGNQYTPINLIASRQSSIEVLDWNEAYSLKQPNYLHFDVKIAYKQNLKKISEELGFDLRNVTNHKNIYSVTYNPSTKQIATVYQQGFLFLLMYRILF